MQTIWIVVYYDTETGFSSKVFTSLEPVYIAEQQYNCVEIFEAEIAHLPWEGLSKHL